MPDRSDLSAVVAAIATGDPTAIQTLYEHYAPQLYRSCLFRIGDVDATQDILQDVFVQVWAGLGSLECRGEAALTAWLLTIASNAVINYVRKRNRQPWVPLESTAEWPQQTDGDMARTVCERLDLRQAVTRLNPTQQHVIALRYGADLSNGEVAQVLGRTEGAVKALHHRAGAPAHVLDRTGGHHSATAATTGGSVASVTTPRTAQAANGRRQALGIVPSASTDLVRPCGGADRHRSLGHDLSLCGGGHCRWSPNSAGVQCRTPGLRSLRNGATSEAVTPSSNG